MTGKSRTGKVQKLGEAVILAPKESMWKILKKDLTDLQTIFLKTEFQKEVAHGLCISAITLAELEYGMAHSSNPVQNKQALLRFLLPLNILAFGESAGVEYGKIRDYLQKKRTPFKSVNIISSEITDRHQTAGRPSEREPVLPTILQTVSPDRRRPSSARSFYPRSRAWLPHGF